MSYYIHHTPGRLRVRTPVFREDPSKALEARELMQSFMGVHSVESRSSTGSLIIQYDPELTAAEDLAWVLSDRGYIPPKTAFRRQPDLNPFAVYLIEKLTSYCLQIFFRRSMAAVLCYCKFG